MSAVADPHLPWVETSRLNAPGTRYQTFHSRTVAGPVSFLLHTPPSYESAPLRRYPVVYWLHGLQGDQRQGSGFVKRLLAAYESGLAPEMLVVLVNGLPASMYADSVDGRAPVESMLIDDLVPYVDEHWRTDARREARALEGMSMGGCGAAYLGFKYTSRFGLVSILAGALDEPAAWAQRRPELFASVFGGSHSYLVEHSPWTMAQRNAEALRERTRIRLVVGERDEWLSADRRFHERLLELGVPHEFSIVPGAGHHYHRLYDGLGADAFRFWSEGFGLLAPPHHKIATSGESR